MSDLLQPVRPPDASKPRFVSTKTFLELLLSRRSLERTEDPRHRYSGLIDLESGARYFCDDRRAAERR